MKATENFEQAVNNHLQGLAAKDPLFAQTLAKPNKNIKDCINYIFSEVQKSGCNGFADEEVYAMAVHYYDEDDIKPGKAINATVVINQAMPKPKAKTTTAPAKKAAPAPAAVCQSSLF